MIITGGNGNMTSSILCSQMISEIRMVIQIPASVFVNKQKLIIIRLAFHGNRQTWKEKL
jgi:hypothetical protein